jgi:nucleoside-diphosphate-sugar epimerase
MVAKLTEDETSGRVAANFKGKNVLVTGGFGFVGGHMAKTLIGFGANVTVFDNRTDPKIDSLLNDPALHLRDKVKVVNGDIGDGKMVRAAINEGEFEYIFNFAAYATVIEKAVENPGDTIQANTIGLVNIMESVRGLKKRPAMIFHASTDKVYGEMDGEAYEEEKTPLRGIGVYDGAKLAADVFARTYHEVFGLPTVVLRMCNLFGPCDFNTGYRLIPKAMHNLYAATQPVGPELYFDAIEHWRDYLYIDDCIRAILLLAYHTECRGQVFNLAAARFSSTPELLKTIVQQAYEIEKDFDKARAEAILSNGIVIKVRASNPSVLTIKKQRLNGDKIKRMTGFEPSVEFTEAIGRTIRAYRGHFNPKGKSPQQ